MSAVIGNFPAEHDGIAVAAISARVMVESIAGSAGRVIALDLFGDRDTRAAAARWHCIGSAARLTFDDEALLQALGQLARDGEAAGWVAGSGFEARPDLIERGAAILPLIGNAAEVVRQVRTPEWFYPWLGAQQVPHAEVSMVRPEPADGWLAKDALACGGWHVRPAVTAVGSGRTGRYFQRRIEGMPMSVLFLADGRQGYIVGIARQIIRPLGGHAFVYRGVLGPVALAAEAWRTLQGMLERIVPGLGLTGLNGIDFILNGDTPVLIELNPRPTASLALFDACVRGGLMRAHVAVCGGAPIHALEFSARSGVCGSEVVFARRAGCVDAALADWMDAQGWCHDLPAADTQHAYGDPVCSVSAGGARVEEVEQMLAARRRQVRSRLAAVASIA